MEDLIEELTKVNPANLSEEGLKLFNKINEIIDRNKDLEEANHTLAFEFGKREMEIKQLNKMIDEMAKELAERTAYPDEDGIYCELFYTHCNLDMECETCLKQRFRKKVENG